MSDLQVSICNEYYEKTLVSGKTTFIIILKMIGEVYIYDSFSQDVHWFDFFETINLYLNTNLCNWSTKQLKIWDVMFNLWIDVGELGQGGMDQVFDANEYANGTIDDPTEIGISSPFTSKFCVCLAIIKSAFIKFGPCMLTRNVVRRAIGPSNE